MVSNLVVTWGPSVLWAGVLFLLSHQPDLPNPFEWALADKAGHLVVYAVLGWTLGRGRLRTGMPHALILAAGLAWAASDEIHQSFVPGRFPSGGDLVADAVGIALGYYLTLKFASTPRRAPTPAPEGAD